MIDAPRWAASPSLPCEKGDETTKPPIIMSSPLSDLVVSLDRRELEEEVLELIVVILCTMGGGIRASEVCVTIAIAIGSYHLIRRRADTRKNPQFEPTSGATMSLVKGGGAVNPSRDWVSLFGAF